MLRKYSVLMAIAAMFAVAAPAQAQIYIGPEVAWNGDADLGIGAGVEFDLDSVTPGFGVMADFLYFFPGDNAFFSEVDTDYWEINGNVTYDLPLENSQVLPFILGGVNIANISVNASSEIIDFDESSTEVGFNLGGGIQFDLGSFRPRAGARFVLGGAETFSIFGFLPFAVGG